MVTIHQVFFETSVWQVSRELILDYSKPALLIWVADFRGWWFDSVILLDIKNPWAWFETGGEWGSDIICMLGVLRKLEVFVKGCSSVMIFHWFQWPLDVRKWPWAIKKLIWVEKYKHQYLREAWKVWNAESSSIYSIQFFTICNTVKTLYAVDIDILLTFIVVKVQRLDWIRETELLSTNQIAKDSFVSKG